MSNGDAPTVLLCDDDPGSREVVSGMLERRGYRVTTASTGPEAIEHAARRRPDAILLDLMMPRVSGWEAAAALKERAETRDIPIVVLSALSEDYRWMPRPDAVGWVCKPVDEAALLAAVDQALSHGDRQ